MTQTWSEIAPLLVLLLEATAFEGHGPCPARIAAYPRFTRSSSLDYAVDKFGLAPLEEAAIVTPAARAHVETDCNTNKQIEKGRLMRTNAG